MTELGYTLAILAGVLAAALVAAIYEVWNDYCQFLCVWFTIYGIAKKIILPVESTGRTINDNLI